MTESKATIQNVQLQEPRQMEALTACKIAMQPWSGQSSLELYITY